MTNTKNTKRALLSSVLALFLCFAMLLGTTYAWFTDSVTSAGNIIQSGTLDIEMYWAEGTKDPSAADTTWTDASTGAIFNNDKWEPGYVEVRHIKIANEGTLALKYQIKIVANGEVSDLADVIDVYYVDPAQQIADRTALTDDNKLGTLTDVLANLANTANGELPAGENDTITLALKMQESAGNEYQNKSIGSDFSVILMATQLTAESDSFDDQYDKDAKYTAEIDQLKAKLATAQSGDTVEYALTHDAYIDSMIKVPNGVTLVLNGNGHQAIVNTAYPFYVNNANIQMNDLTITGKATYAIFTKGAIWDYNGNNATVNASFNNVTVDLDKASNFPVTFNGMGNITMKDCTVKGAGLPSGDYADGMHVFAGAEINLTVDGGEIGGIMLNSNYAAAATMDVKNGAVIEKVDLEVSSASDGSNVVAPVTVSADSTVEDMFHAVYSANQLVKVLEAGGNALLVNNITTSNKLTVKDGAYLDGNGKTIDFAGNFNGYEKALNLEGGATVKNLNVANAGRAYGSDGNDGDIYLDNISGTNAHYFFNGDTTTNSNVYVTNSTLDGWISYGNANLFSFDNCVLKGETSRFHGICYYVVYGDTEFENCTFDNFYMAMNQGAVNSGATGSVVTITNCVYVTSEGTVKVTADNFKSLLMGPGDEADFNRMLNNATIIVDGVTVAN